MPGYYDNDFPKEISDWKVTRELAKFMISPRAGYKMNVMEWGVKALYNITDDETARNKAKEIFKKEWSDNATKAPALQVFGNFLALLLSKVGVGKKDHEPIEVVFKYILGNDGYMQNTPLKNELLNCIVDFSKDHDLRLRPAVLEYDAQHRIIPPPVESYFLTLRLQPQVADTAEDEDDEELQRALIFSLQDNYQENQTKEEENAVKQQSLKPGSP